MTVYSGFNTINQTKKFVLTDYELVKRDILNSFLIKQGEVPGRPLVGSTIWSIVFDNQTDELKTQLDNEVRRTIAHDKRVSLDFLDIEYIEHGVILDLTVTVLGLDQQVKFGLYFDRITNRALLV